MNAIVAADLHLLDAEPRIPDSKLALALGYRDAEYVRKAIDRNFEELSSYGEVLRQTVGKPLGSRGGRPSLTYLLNEQQALLICMFARTANAAKVRAQVIAVYMDWRRTRIAADSAPLPPRAEARPAVARLAPIEDVARVVDLGADIQALGATLAPFWSSGRRPKFWSDFDVRRHFVELHRQVTIDECRALCSERFGPERTPSKSAAHRFWIVLDMARRARP
ncbi:hypothetical protein [Methylosinus sp. Sm6]|uniref:hypothetical protein n=1 Tax=Methylosinus sp. Sm6 TaxID=2866948 RepID=UPI001C99FC97|nr:hypothetical protein [Methylosinus sp. Sm6]MBY6244011.1 hypothetical protein [Methylosinus sp. Sm6]